MYKTLTEACRAWVNSFNAVPFSAVEKLYDYNPRDFAEITPPSKYDVVYVLNKNEYGEIIKTNYFGEYYLIKLDNGKKVRCRSNEFTVKRDGFLPMWGNMWQFSDPCDTEWANGEYLGPHLQEMADCGFRVYENEDYGLLFGIDGAGYDFYKAHWIPLYKARGLQWHETDDTKKKAV